MGPLTPRRLAALLLLAVLLAPGALAAPARVRLVAEEGAWNGVSEAAVGDDGLARVWVPAGARVQSVLANGTSASWRAWGADALQVEASGASSVQVAFDLAPGAVRVARYVAPEDVELAISVDAPPGTRVESPTASFGALPGGTGSEVFARATLREGEALEVRVVDAGRVPTSTVLLAVAALALVVLLAAIAWHAARPPAPARAEARFLDHLAELQARLLPPVVAFGLLNVLYFTVGLRVSAAPPLPVPVLDVGASLAARCYQALAELVVPPAVELVAIRPVDSILAQVQVALFLAFVTVLPLLAYEIGAFIGPALLPRERGVARRTLPVVTGLFVAGAAFGLLLMAPLMMRTLYGYAPAVGARPLLTVSDLVTFTLLVSLAFALAFELPVAMFALSRLGVVRAASFRRYLRHAVIVIFVAAGILTPDPSVVSQLLVGLPVTGLYLIGIGAAALGERGRR